MTIKELIEKLKQYPEDSDVYIQKDNHEGPYIDEEINIYFTTQKHYDSYTEKDIIDNYIVID